MNEDIQFLKELQNELKTQSHDSQAEPRFWVVGDYKMVACPEGYQDRYDVNASTRDYYGGLDELLENIKEEGFDDYPDCAVEEFKEINCEISAHDWLREYYDPDAELVPVREEHFIRSNTMFITKDDAKRHIEANYYHYSDKAHTYAMTAWRSPKVKRLWDILETFDWNSIG